MPHASHRDPRLIPTYTVADVAHHLRLPPSTVRQWVTGRARAGGKTSAPIIVPAQKRPLLLSFVNLVEAHVLAAARLGFKIPLPRVREAVRYVERELEVDHPLAHEKFQTDGVDLFVERYGQVVNASQYGQIGLRAVLQGFLQRVEHGRDKLPLRFFPVSSAAPDEKVIVVDPAVAFGKPSIVGTGVPTAILAERRRAGETVDELADDYDIDPEKVRAALAYERVA